MTTLIKPDFSLSNLATLFLKAANPTERAKWFEWAEKEMPELAREMGGMR